MKLPTDLTKVNIFPLSRYIYSYLKHKLNPGSDKHISAKNKTEFLLQLVLHHLVGEKQWTMSTPATDAVVSWKDLK